MLPLVSLAGCPSSQGDFTNIFGCCEIERISEKIVTDLKKRGSWQASLNYWDYREEDPYSLFMLAVNGWIEDVETDGTFRMSNDFGKRILSRILIEHKKRHLQVKG